MTENTETEKRGFWRVGFDITLELEGEDINFRDLSESTQVQICSMIADGCIAGEICEDTD